MSTIKYCPSSALLRSLRQANTFRPAPRLLPIRRQALQTSHPRSEQDSSFRAQLYESTHKRLEKEREDQRRLANQRGEPNSGRTPALSFGLLPNEGWSRAY